MFDGVGVVERWEGLPSRHTRQSEPQNASDRRMEAFQEKRFVFYKDIFIIGYSLESGGAFFGRRRRAFCYVFQFTRVE